MVVVSEQTCIQQGESLEGACSSPNLQGTFIASWQYNVVSAGTLHMIPQRKEWFCPLRKAPPNLLTAVSALPPRSFLAREQVHPRLPDSDWACANHSQPGQFVTAPFSAIPRQFNMCGKCHLLLA